jgi:predicted peptidase
MPFENGIARVGKKDGDPTSDQWIDWHYINKEGKTVWEAKNEIEDQSIIVTPADYDPKKKYGVLFTLPYTGGESRYYMRKYLNDWKTKDQLQNFYDKFLTKANINNPLILVLVPGYGSERDHDVKGFTNAIERYDNRIKKDLEILKKEYSIDDASLYLAGFSLGGDLSWALSHKNPTLFKGAIINGSRCGYPTVNSIKILKEKNFKFYIGMGEQEWIVRTQGAQAAKVVLDKSQIENIYYEIPKRGHDFLPMENFIEALRFIVE